MIESPEHVVIVGGGMVAHRFVENLLARDTEGRYRVTVCAEEPRRAYDRVALATYFTGRHPEDLQLGALSLSAEGRIPVAQRT